MNGGKRCRSKICTHPIFKLILKFVANIGKKERLPARLKKILEVKKASQKFKEMFAHLDSDTESEESEPEETVLAKPVFKTAKRTKKKREFVEEEDTDDSDSSYA